MSVEEGGLLDKAICLDTNSKANFSSSSNKNNNLNQPSGAAAFNMFDSFKQELGMMDNNA